MLPKKGKKKVVKQDPKAMKMAMDKKMQSQEMMNMISDAKTSGKFVMRKKKKKTMSKPEMEMMKKGC